ncbi:putative AMP-activated kinase, glycogen-binding protein [Helianthus annuus]|nr:putative AMP-activated kinase, glycogen-binding protein [Helianthus annuus]KAJ0586952.1 putative AMP-activated kinase, glycogen-binding protein [Helianthus annuus]KAJ0595569.1 putative AMP-activated kinase, glycogen-binding protein [Helianthus annuus]KAJ0756224.1 putative AMP-activated kinase, glycogen-binding protein [Helianthus annuus]KAJ0760002.1 putative AMP-activated kinase, glycogen-binding protein [Helianthus annuus]
MVHTHFVWSHGGNQVFLCGDFTGWIRYHQMVTVEGSLTTFMTICDLPPGLHKFKFFVDGVWRIDEMQPIVEDEYGVNNVVVVEQPSLIPQIYSINDGQSIMHIDGYNGRNHADGASPSGSVPNELEVEITGDEIETTTRRLFKHFSIYKVYDLIPDSGKVFALDDNMTVEEAFLVMHEEGVAVAPLWNAANIQISGVLTASDFIMFLIELQRNRAMATNNVNQFSTISAWKEGKLQLQRRPLVQIHPDDSLNKVAVGILGNHISSIPVLYVPEGSACPQLLHVAYLSGLLEHIHRHFEHRIAYLPLLQRSIAALPIGTWIREVGGARELKTVPTNCLLNDAYRLLIDEHISSVPVVDDKRALVNVFCRSDVLSLAKNNAYLHVQLDQTTISQALQLVDTNTHGRYAICTRSDTLYRVIGLLSDPGIRRVVVVEAGSRYVLGLITLRDVFSLIFRDFS